MSQDSRLQRRPLPSTPDQPAWTSNYMVPRPATKVPPGLSSSAQVDGGAAEGAKAQAASNAIYCLSARSAPLLFHQIKLTCAAGARRLHHTFTLLRVYFVFHSQKEQSDLISCSNLSDR